MWFELLPLHCQPPNWFLHPVVFKAARKTCPAGLLCHASSLSDLESLHVYYSYVTSRKFQAYQAAIDLVSAKSRHAVAASTALFSRIL